MWNNGGLDGWMEDVEVDEGRNGNQQRRKWWRQICGYWLWGDGRWGRRGGSWEKRWSTEQASADWLKVRLPSGQKDAQVMEAVLWICRRTDTTFLLQVWNSDTTEDDEVTSPKLQTTNSNCFYPSRFWLHSCRFSDRSWRSSAEQSASSISS